MICIRVAKTLGSAPREAGAEMLVTESRLIGTIGGGQMEYDAIARARHMLSTGENHTVMQITLGPGNGQCCGGKVQLTLDRSVRSVPPPQPQILIFGAGHVGRALGKIMSQLPFDVTLYDSREDELAQAVGTRTVQTALPEAAIRAAPPRSAYVIMTYNHGIDFLLTAEALRRGDAAYVGLIGSATKRARFLHEVRTENVNTSSLTCPIGAGRVRDKRPEIIAIFTAAEITAKLIDITAID